VGKRAYHVFDDGESGALTVCGIAGITDFSGPVDQTIVESMCAAMVHRGPDGGGIHHEDGVCLGARRLAIIDIAGGQQPVYDEDRSIVVVMNGEIYNHDALRSELVARGHTFRSQVDTEVLVHLYEEEGDELVHHLHGMFAFALWDRRRRRLLCARDRVGKKPLFWFGRGPRVAFASELWALLQDPGIERRVDPAAMAAFLTYAYVPHEFGAIQGVHKVPPANRLIVDADGARLERYWKLHHAKSKAVISKDEAASSTRELLMEATRRRLVSEVPLGAFLSGGIDSSIVVACMAASSAGRLKTFSIAFEESDFDEMHYARQVAQHFDTDHHEFVVRPDALTIMAKMARHYGEPYADPSAVPSFYLAELAHRHVTVALNGDGGDESFSGYDRYRRVQQIMRLQALPLAVRRAIARLAQSPSHRMRRRERTRRMIRGLRLLTQTPADLYLASVSTFDSQARSRLLRPEFINEREPPEEIVRRAWDAADATDTLDRMMSVDVETYLPDDLLVKMDIATMASSVEARSPFLDHEVMEFAAALPPSVKRRGGESKIALKAAFRDLLPAAVIERSKMGFGIPLAQWFRRELTNVPQEVLLDPGSSSRDYFRVEEIERLIRDHTTGEADHSMRLWVLLQLEMWHREVVDAPRSTSGGHQRVTSQA
jgi:asparagine synthase (glutamine-hydrolysing)